MPPIHNSRILLSLLIPLFQSACASAPHIPATPQNPTDPTWITRYQSRGFPSVFSPWESTRTLNLNPHGPVTPLSATESPTESLCRHDLIWSGAGVFDLEWNNRYPGLADGFTQESVIKGLRKRAEILKCNPNAVIAVEIRHRDARGDFLPEDSPWWKRDSNGQRIIGWKEGGYFLLDYSHPDFQKRIAAQCLAAVRSKVVDGCFIDWWSKENSDRLALIKKVREAIGENALLIVNANGARPTQSAPYINGIYMEGFGTHFFSGWQTAAENLLWARTALRSPAITAFESWYPHPKPAEEISGRNDLKQMRMFTAISLIFSDGTILYADPNPLPTPDHIHDWYPFWDKTLGKPTEPPGIKRADGTYSREFEKGTVVFNPPENTDVTVGFAQKRTSRATRKQSRRHQVQPGDGDLFLF